MERLFQYPAITAAAVSALLLTSFYWATGTLFPERLPDYARSEAQITGMALMLIVLPAYFLAAAIAVRRHSLDLVDQLRPVLPDPRRADEAQADIRAGLARSWLLALPFGIVLGLSNTNPVEAARSSVFAIDASISAGQMLLWIGIALFGGARLISANAFSRLGDVVDLDLFRLDRLKPLARSGLVDILIIAGALAVSPLQSLDAQFRWYNYRFALIVAIPSAAILLLWPLRHVHRRIRAEKDRRIAEIDERIEAASQAPDDLPRFEALLAHRDRLREQHTWLLSSALLSRLFFYLIIPPLAWVGAALVERWVGRAIGG